MKYVPEYNDLLNEIADSFTCPVCQTDACKISELYFYKNEILGCDKCIKKVDINEHLEDAAHKERMKYIEA